MFGLVSIIFFGPEGLLLMCFSQLSVRTEYVFCLAFTNLLYVLLFSLPYFDGVKCIFLFYQSDDCREKKVTCSKLLMKSYIVSGDITTFPHVANVNPLAFSCISVQGNYSR